MLGLGYDECMIRGVRRRIIEAWPVFLIVFPLFITRNMSENVCILEIYGKVLRQIRLRW